MSARYCGQCGESAEPGERYCIQCGQPLRMQRTAEAPTAEPGDSLVQGVSLLAQGKNEEALAALDVICAETPTRAIARAYRGLALLRTTRVPEARAELEEAVRLAPNSFVCRMRYAEFLTKLGFYDQAVAQLDVALALPSPNEGMRSAAVELRKFGREKARGIFYRRITSPKEIRVRNLLPWGGGPTLQHSIQTQRG